MLEPWKITQNIKILKQKYAPLPTNKFIVNIVARKNELAVPDYINDCIQSCTIPDQEIGSAETTPGNGLFSITTPTVGGTTNSKNRTITITLLETGKQMEYFEKVLQKMWNRQTGVVAYRDEVLFDISVFIYDNNAQVHKKLVFYDCLLLTVDDKSGTNKLDYKSSGGGAATTISTTWCYDNFVYTYNDTKS